MICIIYLNIYIYIYISFLQIDYMVFLLIIYLIDIKLFVYQDIYIYTVFNLTSFKPRTSTGQCGAPCRRPSLRSRRPPNVMDIRTVLVFLKEWRCFCWEKVGKSY